MSTYLSLDLDFFNARRWRSEQRHLEIVADHLAQVAAFVRARRVPCVAVMNHQQMLRFVNASGCTRLVNVDTHSDLTEAGVEEFNCGTWVSYVAWRKNGAYHWHHGDKAKHGECSASPSGLFSAGKTPKMRAALVGWKTVTHTRDKEMPKLTPDITSIGVCLSPSFVDGAEVVTEVLQQWTKKHGIPYVRGRWDERFSTPRKPKS